MSPSSRRQLFSAWLAFLPGAEEEPGLSKDWLGIPAYRPLTGRRLPPALSAEELDFIGAPEEIRTPDPQIRSLGPSEASLIKPVRLAAFAQAQNRPPPDHWAGP
jgi:hypothetical protein